MRNTITLYELMDRSCESIEASPGNYFQAAWARRADALVDAQQHACGTAFCRAGWMMAHVSEPKTTEEWCGDFSQCDIEYDAKKLLFHAGASYDDVKKLFAGSAIDYRIPVGSPAYVEAGIKGMRDFMAKYEAQLKVATVEVWEPDPIKETNA